LLVLQFCCFVFLLQPLQPCCTCCCSYWPLLSHINALCWQLGLGDVAAVAVAVAGVAAAAAASAMAINRVIGLEKLANSKKYSNTATTKAWQEFVAC